MEPQFCTWLKNFDPEARFLRVRNAYKIHCIVQDVDVVRALVPFNNEKLFAYCTKASANSTVYDVTTSTEALDYTTSYANVEVPWATKFNRRLAFIGVNSPATSSAQYNGAADTWGTVGFTYSGSAIAARCGVNFKGRVYLFDDSGYMYYGALGAITGAMSRFAANEIFEDSVKISWCGTITNSQNSSTENFLCFGSEGGEILIYAGDNPEAANWELVGRFKTARPLSSDRPVLAINNDLWLCTEAGLLSIRKLSENGTDVLDLITISGAINPYWSDLLNEGKAVGEPPRAGYITYWPEQNKVFVLMNRFIENDGTATGFDEAATMLVYNIVSNAWSVHKITEMNSTHWPRSVCYFNNAIYFATGNNIYKMDGSGFRDHVYNSIVSQAVYDFELESSYINFGSSNKNKKVEGFDLVIRSDFEGGSFGMYAAADFGRKISLISYNSILLGFSNPTFSVGVDGNYTQYRIEGSTTTGTSIGLELFSVGAAIR